MPDPQPVVPAIPDGPEIDSPVTPSADTDKDPATAEDCSREGSDGNEDEGRIRERLEAALDKSIDGCARCKVCDTQIGAAMTVLGPLLERAEAAEAALTRESLFAAGQTDRAEAAERKLTATPEQMLREFHAAKAIHNGLMPERPTTDIPDWVRDLRMALLDEEVEELREAVAAGDIVAIADALGDIEHVTRGTAVAYGIPSDAVFAEIFRSNMTKVNSPAEGKLVKGPGYSPPDIAGVLGIGTEGDAGHA